MTKSRYIIIFTIFLGSLVLFNCSQDKSNAPLTHWMNPYSSSQPLYYFWNHCYAEQSFEDGSSRAKKMCDCKAKFAESLTYDEQIASTFLFERLSPYYKSDYNRLNKSGTIDKVGPKLKNSQC